MSASPSIYIKEEVSDYQEIKQEITDLPIKVEIDESVEEFWNNDEEIEEKVSTDGFCEDDQETSNKGLSEKELNHIKWLQMKTQDLDTMKGKYNTQLQEYLSLAKKLKESNKNNPPENPLIINNPVLTHPVEYEREKTIIPSRKKLSLMRKQQVKRVLKTETLGTSIRKRMRPQEINSYNLARDKYLEEGISIEETTEYHGKTPEVGELKRHKKLMRKTELERERRAGLTQLFEDLDYWVEMDEGYYSIAPNQGRRTRFNKLPYHERTNAAIKCIHNLETSIRNNEHEVRSLQTRNDKLKLKLKSLQIDGRSEIVTQKPRQQPSRPLYSCDKCNIGFNTVQDAFTHESNMKHGKQEDQSDKYVVYDGRVMKRAKPQADKWNVYRCRDCPTVCLDSLFLQVHKFLHQDLTYFFCSECDDIFGLPSKLKRHYFLAHGKILASEHQHVLGLERRIEMTVKIQEYIAISDPGKVDTIDNFLDASLDAKLILDELAMSEEVGKIPLNDLGGILKQYLRSGNCQDYVEEDPVEVDPEHEQELFLTGKVV